MLKEIVFCGSVAALILVLIRVIVDAYLSGVLLKKKMQIERLRKENQAAVEAARQAELRALSQQAQQPQQQPSQQTSNDKLKKWTRVDFDQNLARIC